MEEQQPQRPAWLDTLRRLLSSRAAEGQRWRYGRGTPEMPVVVEFDTPSWQAVERGDELREAVCQHVEATVRADLVALGIPARPLVELRPDGGATDALGILVHGRRCHLGGERAAEVLDQLTGPDRRSLPELTGEELAPAVAAVCEAAIHRHPSVLLGAEQLRRYGAALAKAGPGDAGVAWPPDDQQLRRVLEPVLDAGVGVGDLDTVAELVAEGQVEGIAPMLTAERLVDRLRAPTVQIRADEETLRWMTERDGDDESFRKLREVLFAEAGALFPDFVFVEIDEPRPRTVHFGLNSLVTPPVRLWDDRPLQAAARCLAAELRAHRGWFVCTGVVHERLRQLELAFPDLVAAINDHYPLEWLSALDRALFREEVSARDLKQILEGLLDLGDVGAAADVARLNESAAGGVRPVVGASPPDPRAVVSYLRQRSNERLFGTFALEQEATVLPLGAELERLAVGDGAESGQPGEQRAEALVEAVRRRLADAPPGQVSLAVSSVPVRSVVRKLLEPGFPRVPVVAVQELPLPRGRPATAPEAE